MENNIKKHLDKDLYQVETENGQKQIHIDGYCYAADGDLKLVQYTGCIIAVSEIGDDMEKLNELEDSVKQYIKDGLTEEEVKEYYKEATELPIVEVTQDTPDGWYIDMEGEEKQEEKLSPYQKVILDYLQERAKQDPTIAANLQKKNKTIGKCWNYIVSEARKAATNNVAMIADEVVFGWAVHYYDEDNIETDKKPAPKAKAVKVIVPERAQVKKERFVQCDLFSELGM